jgi:hypothetical protein
MIHFCILTKTPGGKSSILTLPGQEFSNRRTKNKRIFEGILIKPRKGSFAKYRKYPIGTIFFTDSLKEERDCYSALTLTPVEALTIEAQSEKVQNALKDLNEKIKNSIQ